MTVLVALAMVAIFFGVLFDWCAVANALERRASRKARRALMIPEADDPRWTVSPREMLNPAQEGFAFTLGPFDITDILGPAGHSAWVSVGGVMMDVSANIGSRWARELRVKHGQPTTDPVDRKKSAALALAAQFHAANGCPALPPDAEELQGKVFR